MANLYETFREALAFTNHWASLTEVLFAKAILLLTTGEPVVSVEYTVILYGISIS